MTDWQRVTRDNPCKICGRGDWCTYTTLGACCMRVESGHSMHNGGWWHRHTIATTHPPLPTRLPRKKVEGKCPDFESILRNADHTKLEKLSAELKVTIDSLTNLGTVYLSMYHAYGFPMSLPSGKVVGIRLRNDKGEKWAIKGSHAGLFMPLDRLDPTDLFICEGPTDTAAALSIGLFAIGRHACLGQEEMVSQVIKDTKPKNVYIVCDNDPLKMVGNKMARPGLLGAKRLALIIKRNVRMVLPPAKDLREFVSFGGTRDLLFSSLRELQSLV